MWFRFDCDDGRIHHRLQIYAQWEALIFPTRLSVWNSIHASSKLEALLFEVVGISDQHIVNPISPQKKHTKIHVCKNTYAKQSSTEMSIERRDITTLAETKLMIGINFKTWSDIWTFFFRRRNMLQVSKPSHALTRERQWKVSRYDKPQIAHKTTAVTFPNVFVLRGEHACHRQGNYTHTHTPNRDFADLISHGQSQSPHSWVTWDAHL